MGVMQHPAAIPPAPAVMAILNRFNRDELGHTIEVLIALLDVWDGDPDAETGNDVEDDFELTANAIDRATRDPSVDCVDQDAGAYVEWHTMRCSQKRGENLLAGHEDDEEDDDAGQCTEDEISCGWPSFGDRGPGCSISDPDFCAVECGELTTHESFIQGCGSAAHEDDDDEPRRVAPEWPLAPANS